jgi:signal transduction histidine kinase
MSQSHIAQSPDSLTPELQRQSDTFNDLDIFDTLLSAVPSMVMVLNQERRIVYANRAMADFLNIEDRDALLGHSPGNVWHCEHAMRENTVCGETEYCQYCGANRAIRQAQQGSRAVHECRIMRDTDEDPPALDLRIWTTPFTMNGECFIILAAEDIGDEKRRQALERIFFHDILNTANIINGAAELLTLSFSPEDIDAGADAVDEEVEIAFEPMSNAEVADVHRMIRNAAQRLIEEIKGQRQLIAIENREVAVTPSTVKARAFLQSLLASYRRQEVARDRTLALDPESIELEITTDRSLLSRILGNLIKNALEAEEPGATIIAGCRALGEGWVEFWVHNPAEMSDAVKRQVFQRSFSTKGRGRGLGTYSIKLLTERYLGGEIRFMSEPGEGTIFYARYPVAPDRTATPSQ